MQLREHFNFDIRQVMATLPRDGEVRQILRKFTLQPRVEGRARSVKVLAECLGVSVDEISLPRGMNGRLVQDPWTELGFRIEINCRLSVRAKRFSVLHELGHLFRHQDNDGEFDPFTEPMHFDLSGQTFYLDPVEEREANEWAEAVLFGDGQLAAAVGLVGQDLAKLSKYFGVTEAVVGVALKKLK